MNSEPITIEEIARRGRVTWRTARNRLDNAGIRPVTSNRKSALYEPVSAYRAVLYPDPADQAQIDRLLDFIGSCLLPATFSTSSPILRYFIGLLRERGCSKAEALQEAGAMLMMMMESITTCCLPGELKAEPPDWLKLAGEISDETGLNGLPLMEEYVKRNWPDES